MRRHTHPRRALAATAVALLALAACKKKEAPEAAGADAASGAPATPAAAPAAQPPQPTAAVSSMELGRSIGSDNRVRAVLTTFAPKDTIYASVTTANTPSGAQLAAKWSYQTGQRVDSTAREVAGNGSSAVTEFHVSKPGGWPAGKYTVEIFLNGTSAGKQEFEVKKK